MKARKSPGRSHVPLVFAAVKGSLAGSPLPALDGREDQGQLAGHAPRKRRSA